jgi:hypothetical protein
MQKSLHKAELHHDNACGARKLSAVATGHTMQVKSKGTMKSGGGL